MPPMTTPDLFASGAYLRASDAPGPGQQWPQPPQLSVNTDEVTLRDISRAREASLSGLFGALDNKRPRAWDQYGYPLEVTFAALLQAYERGGPAHGAVHKLLDKCWQELPRIKQPEADEETEWEKRTAKVFKDAGIWRKLRDLDRRNMVGRYAAVIYRMADGRDLSQPLVRAQRLVDIVPVYEDQIKVARWDSDAASETFGKPLMWQYRARRPSAVDTQGQPDEWADVHPSRVQVLAEGSVGDFFDGVPLLRPGFNALIDLEKISGGSAEGFLKNSARTVVLQYDAGADVRQIAATPGQATPSGSAANDAIQDKVRDLNRNIDSAIVLQGGEAKTLQTSQISPAPSFEVAANIFAASVRIPYTILFGQQTGRLASDEDAAEFDARAKSRQCNDLTPMVEEFVKRMQLAGIIDGGEFEVEWPDLSAPSDTEKLDNALKMTQIAKTAAEAGITEPVFDSNEIRGAADYEERTNDGRPQEGDLTPEEKALADAAARAAAGQPPAPQPGQVRQLPTARAA